MIQNDKAEPKSAWEVKRKIRVSVALATAADAKTVEQALRDLDGVLQVSAVRTRRTIGVRYLVTKTDYRALKPRSKRPDSLPLRAAGPDSGPVIARTWISPAGRTRGQGRRHAATNHRLGDTTVKSGLWETLGETETELGEEHD
jgi:hypothetical protein